MTTPTACSRRLCSWRGSVSAMTTIGDHLVGRTAEMAAVDDALGGIRGGAAACLVVQGEPGIGKTRLLAELAARADARGCTVLSGSASELERDLPFWVFVDALDEYVAGLDPRLVGVAARRRARRAGAGPARRWPTTPRRRRRCCRTSATARTGRCASCSSGSRRAGRSCWSSTTSTGPTPRRSSCSPRCCAARPTPPSCSCVAGRPRQLAGAPGGGPRARRSPRRLTRIELAGLPREAAGELLGRAVGRERADALYAESGGNPFYLQQLARSDGAAGDGAPPGRRGAGGGRRARRR